MTDALLPAGWVMATVESVGKVQLGRQRAPANHTGPNMRPYLRVANVFEDRIDLSDVMSMNFEPDEYERFVLSPGDILLNEGQSKELVGRSAIFNGELEGACFTNSLVRFRPSSCVDGHYSQALFKHYLRNGTFQSIAQITTNIAHLGKERFATLDFPLPPLAEQRRIVAKLNALNTRSRRAKQALDEIPDLIGKFKRSLLAAAFRGDLTADWREKHPDVEPASELLKRIRIERRRRWEETELAKMRGKGKLASDDRWKAKYVEPTPVDEGPWAVPKNWTWATIETVGDVHLGQQRAPQYLTGQHSRPYLRVANVKEDRILLDDINEMDFGPGDFEHYRLEPGDIMLSEGQSPELVGESAIYLGGIDGVCFQKTLHRFRRFGSAPSPAYAQLVFRHFLRSGIFRSYASQTTNMAHLTLVRLKQIPFPVAPAQEQQEIVKRVSAAMRQIAGVEFAAREATNNLATFDRSILAKAFRGELVEQDARDEPASVLLARIKGSRTNGPSTNGPARRGRRQTKSAFGEVHD